MGGRRGQRAAAAVDGRARSSMAEPRRFTRREVEARTTRADAAIIIDNVVYDVSGFLEDHPGGADVLLDNAGRDASKCFRDVGHSEDAHAWREQYVMGEVAEGERWPVQPREAPPGAAPEPLSLAALAAVAAPPLALTLLSYLLYVYLFG